MTAQALTKDENSAQINQLANQSSKRDQQGFTTSAVHDETQTSSQSKFCSHGIQSNPLRAGASSEVRDSCALDLTLTL